MNNSTRFTAQALMFCALFCWAPALRAEPELNQNQLNQQAEDNFKKSDAELNRVYNALLKKLTPETKEKLVTSQLLWLKFRDAEANARASEFEGGSMAPMLYSGSRNHTTKARIADLKEWLGSHN
jgi:uncharacterized protein YecT (DUF1311 family)